MLLREVVHRALGALIVGKAPIGEGMQALLTLGAAVTPSPLWRGLQRIDWDADAKPFVASVRKGAAVKPPPRTHKGLWFEMPELFNPPEVVWGGTDGDSFDSSGYPSGRMTGWPSPQTPYVVRSLKAAISFLERNEPPESDDEEESDAECAFGFAGFACTLGATLLLAAEAAQQVEPALLLGSRKSITVFAGPAGGEQHALGAVTKQGWRPSPRCWLASHEPDAYDDVE